MSDFPEFQKLSFYKETPTVATDHTEPISKMETAKDILERHRRTGAVNVPLEDALRAMQEIADKAWEASRRFHNKPPILNQSRGTGIPDKSTFMKSLFPLKEI